jgi:hypothetical protein
MIDSTVAFTTWPRIEQEVEGALKTFSFDDPSVERSTTRLGETVINAIRWHGQQTASLRPDVVPGVLLVI